MYMFQINKIKCRPVHFNIANEEVPNLFSFYMSMKGKFLIDHSFWKSHLTWEAYTAYPGTMTRSAA